MRFSVLVTCLGGFIAVALAGCANQVGRAQGETNLALQSMEYSAGGKTYMIRYKWDNLLAGYGVELTRVGTPFTGATSEDAEAQNTIRDAFRAKVCKQGLHPGLLGIGYRFYATGLFWGAKVKCTEKFQANI